MLNKLVNGQVVICSPEEEASIRAEWAAAFEKNAVDQPVRESKRSQIQTLKQRLKILSDQPDLTNAEIKEAVMKFIKLQVLKEELGE